MAVQNNITTQTPMNDWRQKYNLLATYVGDTTGLIADITDNIGDDTVTNALNYIHGLATAVNTNFAGAVTFQNTISVAGVATFTNNVNVEGSLAFNDSGSAAVNIIYDEDNMVSNSATGLATQQSIKAYVDNAITNVNAIQLGGLSSAQFLRSDANDALNSDTNLDIGAGSGAVRLLHSSADNVTYFRPNIGTAGFDATKDFAFDGDTEYWFFDSELRVNGLFTSRGIDDNATANVLQLENSSATLKQPTTIEGSLTITSGNVTIPAGDMIQITNANGEYLEFDNTNNELDIYAGGTLAVKTVTDSVSLYASSIARLTANTSGISVNGNIALNDATGVQITNSGGEIVEFNPNLIEIFAGNVEQLQIQNTDVQIRHGGSNRLVTTAQGVSITGSVTATGDGTFNTSDERLKTLVYRQEFSDPLYTLQGIHGIAFIWNEKAEHLIPDCDYDAVHYGVLAKDIEKSYPGALGPEVDGYKTVNYSSIIPLLIEAVKQLSDKTDQLEYIVEQLENK